MERSGAWLRVGPSRLPALRSHRLPVPGSVDLAEVGLRLVARRLPRPPGYAVPRDTRSVAFDADRLPDSLVVRPRRAGDRFVPFGLSDLFVPLKSAFRPISVAFGIVAMYGMVIVLVSSWVRKRLGTVWWRRLHLLAVPMFTLTLLHGLFAGSDSARPWMFAIYVVTGLITLFLVIVRGLTVGFRPTRDVKERVERAVPVAASATHAADRNVPPEPARTTPLP